MSKKSRLRQKNGFLIKKTYIRFPYFGEHSVGQNSLQAVFHRIKFSSVMSNAKFNKSVQWRLIVNKKNISKYLLYTRFILEKCFHRINLIPFFISDNIGHSTLVGHVLWNHPRLSFRLSICPSITKFSQVGSLVFSDIVHDHTHTHTHTHARAHTHTHTIGSPNLEQTDQNFGQN